MVTHRLVTLGRVALLGPSGPVLLSDVRHLAVLVRVAFAPGRSLPTNAILLTVWPHLTEQRGRAELAGAARAIAELAGAALLEEAADRWTLDARVACDADQAGPDAALSFLTGMTLPPPETPEWDEWVAEARHQIAARPRAAGTLVPWRLVWAVAAAVILLVLGYRATRPRPIAGFEPGDRVVLAAVRSDPPDSSLERSLQFAALAQLQQSSRIDLYPRARVAEALQALGKGLDRAGFTAELAVAVAAREGVPWVVAIDVRAEGPHRRVSTRLIRVSTGDTSVTVARSAAGLLDLIGTVGNALRDLERRLGEPADRLRRQLPLDVATTANLEALTAYSQGAEAWRRGEFTLAQDYWQRAVTLDTGFAMAMGSLGAFHYYHHNREQGERYFRDALARLGRLTEWERLNLEEGYASWRGDQDSALALSRTIAETFPRASTFYNAGTVLLQAGRCAEALEVLEQARRLDPTRVNTHINLATCHKQLARYERARDAYLAAGQLDSTILYSNNVNLEFAGASVLTGRLAEAESTLIRMTARPGMSNQALGFRGLGYLAYWRGQISLASEFFRRAAGLSRQQRAAGSLLRNLALVAASRRAAGDQAGVAQTLRQIDSVAAQPGLPPGFLTLAVEPHAAEGHGAGVRALLAEMRSRADPRNGDDSVQVLYAVGALALVEGRPAEAVAAFDQAARFGFPTLLGYRRALALERLGRLDSARIVLGAIVATPMFGSENQIAWTQALIDLGELEERLGRTEQAAATYRRVLDQWSAGDPGLPDLVRARARLAALSPRRDR
ncbi:MAG: tetratricopeptide repeat protein [Gemmatimonadales bacterium]